MKSPVTLSETPSHPKCSHRVRYPGDNGKKRQKWFTNETDALDFKKKIEDELGINGTDFGTITEEERNGLSIWRAFKGKSPSAPSLGAVLEQYRQTWRERNESVTIQEAFDKFIEQQEAEGASDRHLATLRSRLGRLNADHGKALVADMTTGTFQDWLNGLKGTRKDKEGEKLSMTTRENLKTTCRTFFSYCIERGWLSVNPVPLASKKRTREHRLAKHKAPEIMSPADIQTFLHKVEEVAPEVLPFWLVKFFAGIRDAEARRLDWKMVNFKRGEIVLPAEITKTGDGRRVKLEPVLLEWLEPLAKNSGPLSPSLTTCRYYFKKVMRHLRKPKKKGGKPTSFEFPSNAARHSFATFHLYHFRNPGETAIQLGHKSNPAMLWEHYANPEGQDFEPADFWEIRSAQVVSIKKGRGAA